MHIVVSISHTYSQVFRDLGAKFWRGADKHLRSLLCGFDWKVGKKLEEC